MPEKHPLQAKYPDLQKSEPVKLSVEQHRNRGERIPNEPSARLEAWLGDLERIHTGLGASPERQEAQPQVTDRIKKIYHRDYITGTDDDSVMRKLRHDAQIAENQGHGMAEDIMQRVNEKVVEQTRETIQQDQEQSLDAWIDYLTSDDATYPMWFKYYVFRNITKLAELDKEKGEFPKRSKSTTAGFPEINREALAYMEDSLARHYGLKNLDPNNPETEIDPQMKELLDKDANFAKLYKRAIDYAAPKTIENLDVTDGVWVKFDQTNDPEQGKKLANSLHGYGTGWCTAGEGTAQSQLAGGDFYVYYTKSEDGQYSVPRVAIRMQNHSIAEVRGIEADQNLEGDLVPIAEAKMNEVDPQGAEAYKKKAEDMRRLTNIYTRHKDSGELTKEDLRFIYEMDKPIEGFGYQTDPRIEQILKSRDFMGDLEITYGKSNQAEILDAMLEHGDYDFLTNNIRFFDELNNTTAQQLIDTGQGRLVAKNLYKFQGLDNQIAQKLIDKGYGLAVAYILDKFPDLERNNELAQKLIEAGGGNGVAKNLNKFQGLDNTTAQKLIDEGEGEAVAKNLNKFQGLDHNQIAQKLIDEGEGEAVAKNFDKFQGLDHNQIAQQLIDTRQGEAVAKNLDKFQGLDHNQIAQQLIDTRQGEAVADNLDKFQGLDHNQIAQKLIDKGYGLAVANNLYKFQGLDHNQIAQQLIEKGEGWAVADNLDKFPGLSEETMEQLKPYL